MTEHQPGARVRHYGQQWPEAVSHGAGTVVRRERRRRWPGAIVRMDRKPGTDQPYEDWWADEDLYAAGCPLPGHRRYCPRHPEMAAALAGPTSKL